MSKLFRTKAIVAFLLLSVALLSLAANADAAGGRAPGSGSFTLLHTNDMHGRISEGRFDGMGMDRVAALVDAKRAEVEHVLLLDAGDTWHGLPITTLDRGAGMVTIMNTIGYDAMVPGNHDFNYGQEGVTELAEMADFHVIAANIFVEATGDSLLPAYTIKRLGDVTVGIFGLATPETLYKSHPDGTRGLEFRDPAVAAEKMVAELKGRVDVLIALAHLGFEGEYDTRILAEKVSGIDIIVDGHSHDKLEHGQIVGETLIVQAKDYNKYLGVVNVVVENGAIISKEASLIPKEEAMDSAPSPKIVALVDEIKSRQEATLGEVVGESAVFLEGARDIVRTRESNLGNLILDALLEASGADIAFSNGGGFRTSIEAGTVTRGNVIEVLPFGNQIVTVGLTGEQVMEVLEIGVAAYPEPSGAFLHWGGLTFAFDPAQPSGSRVRPEDVLVGGVPIDLEKVYIVATNDFLKAGGDGLNMLVPLDYNEFGNMDEAVARYIAKNSPIDIGVQGRITAK